ncbi:hypothetical protein LMG33818_000036 [Halomonadaceae bacterium LMG 33818]
MLHKIKIEGCVYQDDVVDYLVKNGREDLLRENSDGNQVLGKEVLSDFKKLTPDTVVWIKKDRYWRWRVDQDEPGRESKG